MRTLTITRLMRLDYLWAAISMSLAVDGIRSTLDFSAILYSTIQFTTAVLFVIRRRPLNPPPRKLSCAVAVSSMLYVYLYQFHDCTFSLSAEILLTTGAIFWLLAAFSLGDCFGVLPAYRGLRTGGMYRLVRHPLYASYLVTDVGLLILYPSRWNVLVFAIGVGLFVWRIQYEESVMSLSVSYCEYMSIVPHRLIPRLY